MSLRAKRGNLLLSQWHEKEGILTPILWVDVYRKNVRTRTGEHYDL